MLAFVTMFLLLVSRDMKRKMVTAWDKESKLFNMDTKETDPSVLIIEVTVLQRKRLFEFWFHRD